MSLKDARKRKGLSQSQLAEAANVNVRTLQYYEQGVKDINGAKLNTLLNLSRALECPISDIVTDPALKEKIKMHSID